MRRRVLTFLLVGLVVLGCVFGCVPMRAGAIVPLGLVQSALASYVTSTGYKLYSDQGTGQDILGSLGEVYDDWVTINNRTLSGSLATLAFISASPDLFVSTDNSGHIVIKQAAAAIFQDFADSLQTDYSIPTDGTEVTIVEAVPGSYTDNAGINVKYYSFDYLTSDTSGNSILIATDLLGGVSSPPQYGSYVLGVRAGSSVRGCYATRTNDSTLYLLAVTSSDRIYNFVEYYKKNNNTQEYEFSGYMQSGSHNTNPNSWVLLSSNFPAGSLSNVPLSEKVPTTETEFQPVPGVLGLAASLAQSVIDRANDLSDDDSLVVAVGAGVGASAEDIAGIVAQGVKAQTLDPSVIVVADAVIDTPVQPYPDIDSLGLPQLGAALVSRFPFCIPWDFVDTVKLLSADPVAPDIAVDLFPAAFKSKVGVTGSTEFRINLGDEKYQIIGTFCRWGSLISFCFGLALLTKRMIWTA